MIDNKSGGVSAFLHRSPIFPAFPDLWPTYFHNIPTQSFESWTSLVQCFYSSSLICPSQRVSQSLLCVWFLAVFLPKPGWLMASLSGTIFGPCYAPATSHLGSKSSPPPLPPLTNISRLRVTSWNSGYAPNLHFWPNFAYYHQRTGILGSRDGITVGRVGG